MGRSVAIIRGLAYRIKICDVVCDFKTVLARVKALEVIQILVNDLSYVHISDLNSTVQQFS